MKNVRCYYCSGHVVDTCKEYLGQGKKCRRSVCSQHMSQVKGHTTCLGHTPQPVTKKPWEVECASS